MSTLIELGQAVRDQRKRIRLTQTELAAKARVSRALIAQLEAGRLPEIGHVKLMRILNVLDLDLRLTSLNLKRPVLEDLLHEEEAR